MIETTRLSKKTQRLTSQLVSLGVIVLLSSVGACTQPAETSPNSSVGTAEPATAAETSMPATGTVEITGAAFGDATICTTADELQAAVPNLVVGPPGAGPLVDTAGVTVSDKNGDLQFNALSSGAAGSKLDLFTTENPAYQTAAGVGQGTSIAAAESQYGQATLAYNTESESREFVSFENGPENILFRTGSGAEAGVYSATDSYNETQAYRADAKIQSVWLSDRTCQP